MTKQLDIATEAIYEWEARVNPMAFVIYANRVCKKRTGKKPEIKRHSPNLTVYTFPDGSYCAATGRTQDFKVTIPGKKELQDLIDVEKFLYGPFDD